MEEEIVLPLRLKAISSFLSPGAIFADIGSDHALLPISVCLQDSNAHAIAGEVNRGPYGHAVANVNRYRLGQAVEVRLGNGLAVIEAGEIDELVIAGMGGPLISSILEDGKSKLKTVKKIIAQPNIHARRVRRWLNQNNFYISDEAIVKDNGHLYEIIVSKPLDSPPLKNNPTQTQEMENIFGPILLQTKPSLFYQKWIEEQMKLERVIQQMKQAKVQDDLKIKQFQIELKWIEEVLS